MGTESWRERFRVSLFALCPVERLRCLLVGVSGGADSVALLRLIADLRDSTAPGSFPRLIAGHVHHGLRGRDADLDQALVEALSARLRIECLVVRADAGAERVRWKLSPEAAARHVRMEAFRTWAADPGADALVLAHHQGDQAETVLLRAVRGSGLDGIAGMAPVGRLDLRGSSIPVLRPLLGWTRASILAFVAAAGEAFREDATNRDVTIPRNRVRLEILPALERWVQPGAIRSLARLGGIAGAVARDLRALGERAAAEATVEGPAGAVLLLREPLRTWPSSVLREAVAAAISRLRLPPGSTAPPDPPESARRAVARWIADPAVESATFEYGVQAPGLAPCRIRLELRYGRIRLAVLAPGTDREASAEAPIPALGRVAWGAWEIEATEAGRSDSAEARPGSGWLEERVDADRIVGAGPLSVRAPRRGDSFRPLGAPGTKRLEDFLRERRVWPDERASVPILEAGGEIVWVVGHRIGDAFRVREDTARLLVLRARRTD